jgi:aminoglycoside 6'-N-acetyltransferase
VIGMIATERLVLRRFRPADAPTLRDYRSDREVARYQGWDGPLSVDDAEELVAAFASQDPGAAGWFQYAIERKVDGVHIGDIGVRLHDNLMEVDIGYTLAPVAQGHGYMTEALRGLLDHLFHERGLHRASAECDPRNLRSARLLERLGFRLEGHRRASAWLHGEWADDLLYGLLEDDWPSYRV